MILTSLEEMMKERMAWQKEANERMKNQVVELELQIDQGLRNRQAIITSLERQEDETQPIPTMPNPSLIMSKSPIELPSLKDSTVHILYTNAKTFVDNVLLNHVGGEELNSIDGVGTRKMTKKEIEKVDMGLPKEPNKE
ncbi:hypothetical protein Tco_1298937 [Tanacetum coccineum]